MVARPAFHAAGPHHPLNPPHMKTWTPSPALPVPVHPARA